MENINLTKDSPRELIIKIGQPCGEACNWSGHCCRHASGVLVEDEVEQLAKHLKMAKEDFIDKCLEDTVRYNTRLKQFKQVREKGMPHGRCVFLGKDHRCAIQDVKPLYCKVTNCDAINGHALAEWFALNFFVNPHDAESVRQWAHHLKQSHTIPGGQLNELVPDAQKLSRMISHEMLY
ncbi:MAG: YkgJ family cysteine cluster protein [Nanoarchaeota archaeon]